MTLTIIVSGQPVPKARARVTRFGSFTPEKSVKYEAKIRGATIDAMTRQKIGQIVGPVVVHYMAFFSVPKSWSKRKALDAMSGRIRHTSLPDLDNLGKSVLDALIKHAFADDKQVVRIVGSKHYGEPKMIIRVEPDLGSPWGGTWIKDAERRGEAIIRESKDDKENRTAR